MPMTIEQYQDWSEQAPPVDVQEVYEAFCANAIEAHGDESAVCALREELAYPDYLPNGEWIVACNYEGWGPSMLWRDGEWFYRYGYKADEKMKRGKQEALANARIFFTG